MLPIRHISTLSALHFVEDGFSVCCVCMLALSISKEHSLSLALLYNAIAFLSQPFTGMIAEKILHKPLLAISSTGFMAISLLLLAITGHTSSIPMAYVTAIVVGIGNSLFHVWGGIETTRHSGNDIRALGLFVSTGAVGLSVGSIFASRTLLSVFLGIFCILVLYYLSPSSSSSKIAESDTVRFPKWFSFKPWQIWLVVILMMSIVMFRSMYGGHLSLNIGSIHSQILVVSLIAMCGKALGGFIAWRIGLFKTLSLVFIGLLVCYLFRGRLPHLSVLGFLLINLTMSITLFLNNEVLKGKEGLSFGLLAFSLMPVYLVAQFGIDNSLIIEYILVALLPTILIELAVLRIFERRSEVLWSSVVVNILTNSALNLFVFYFHWSLASILIGELIVLVLESLWYWYFTSSILRSIYYSLLCNISSFLIGLVIVNTINVKPLLSNQ